MDYSQALQYMFEMLPMFHRIGKAAYKADLNNAHVLDSYFNHPHNNYKTIHVAGTNGKGSVSHCLAAILQQAGYKTGLFTSPHLKDFRERIRVNGEMVCEQYVAEFISYHHTYFDTLKPSFFEMTSAMAFEYFNFSKVDVAVIEVGMGGRLDSTNIIIPGLSIITNIGYDHTEFLGDTHAKIAFEKAGIIKPNVPVVIGEYTEETLEVFKEVAGKKQAKLILTQDIYKADYSMFTSDRKQVFQIIKGNKVCYKDLVLDLGGFYQRRNICTVLASIDEMINWGIKIEISHIYEALADVSKNTGLLGRWQILGANPFIVCDTGHNEDGIGWVLQQIKATPHKRLHLIIGFVNDKAIDKILAMLPLDGIYYFTQANIPRALDCYELKAKAALVGLSGQSFKSVSEAYNIAKQNAQADDMIFVGGSTFVVAEVV
jgi:dihydrofolate synthase/folylpolyglutamate synthase